MNIRLGKLLVSAILLAAGTLSYAQTKYPVCIATQTTTTSSVSLTKPGHCVLNWDAIYNSDLDLIDSMLSGRTGVPALTLLANPTQPMQVANKGYVDSAVTTINAEFTTINSEITALQAGGGSGSGGSGGAGGCAVSGDTSSTNCGTGNRTGDTAALPANVTSYGFNGLLANTGTQVVAIGSTPASNNTAPDVVAIGNNPLDPADTTVGDTNGLNDIIAVGDNPLNQYGNSVYEIIALGDNAGANLASFSNDMIMIGDHVGEANFGDDQIDIGNTTGVCGGGPVQMSDAVRIGDNVCSYGYQSITIGNNSGAQVWGGSAHSQMDNISIGDHNFLFPNGVITHGFGVSSNIVLGDYSLSSTSSAMTKLSENIILGDNAGTGYAGMQDVIFMGDYTGESQTSSDSISDVICIGDVACENLGNGASAVIAIGVAPGEVTSGMVGAATESIFLGDSAGDNSTGDENIAIGDAALDGGNPRQQNTGHNIIAIGYQAGAVNSTGIENINIGDSAGCPGCAYSSNGNGNNTGSENINIGDSTGSCSTAQLSDTVVLGDHACADQSNELVLGSATHTTKIKLFGCPAGQVPVADGSGTCVVAGGGGIDVNGSAISGTPNFGSLPAAPSGYTPVQFQYSGSNVSAYVPQTMPTNVNIICTGSSICDDDAETKATTVTISGFTAPSSGVVTFTNTGTNGFHAGDWVNMRYLSSGKWPSPPSYMALGTGYTLFQVLSTGLSATQFEVNVGSLSVTACSVGCGTVESAMNNLGYQIAQVAGMPSNVINNTYVLLPSDVTIRGLAANYSSLFHSISPSVTGNPGYIFVTDVWNDIGICQSVAQIETNYQSFWASAHADGWKIVQSSLPNKDVGQNWGAGFCSFPQAPYYEMVQLDRWLEVQARTQATLATGSYWDIWSDAGLTQNDPKTAGLQDGSATGWQNFAIGIANAMLTGSGMPLPRVPIYWGTFQGTSASVQNGTMFVPPQDGWTWQFTDANMTNDILVMDTGNSPWWSMFNSRLTLNGNSSTSNNFSPILAIHDGNGGVFNAAIKEVLLWNNITSPSSSPGSNQIVFSITPDSYASGAPNSTHGVDFGYDYNSTTNMTLNHFLIHIIGDTYDSLHAATNGQVCVGVTSSEGSSGQEGCPTTKMFSVGTTGQMSVDASGNASVQNLTVNGTCTGCGSSGGGGGLTPLFGTADPNGANTPALVQATAPGVSASVSFSSNVTSGNLIVVQLSQTLGSNGATVSDTRGTSFTQLDTYTGSNLQSETWVGILTSSGADTISVSGASNYDLDALEVLNGSTSVDVSSIQSGSSNSPSAGLTTTLPNDFVIAPVAALFPVTYSINSGWTIDASSSNGTYGSGALAHQIISTASAVIATYTTSGSNAWHLPLIALKANSTPVSGSEGQLYFKTTSTPYVEYVYHSSSWHQVQ